MKKFNLLPYYFVALFFVIISCSPEGDLFNGLNQQKSLDQEATCGESTIVSLIAGQHTDVGTVTVSNDENYLYVTYETTGDWYLTETHLYVGSEEDIPLNGGGNPKIGHFNYHGDHESVKSYTFDPIPLADLDDCFAVVTHAVVEKVINGKTVSEETAFGCGDKEFPGNRWGCYFEYCKQDCEDKECIQAYGFHDGCGFCNDDSNGLNFYNVLAYTYLADYSLDIDLYINPNGCDLNNSEKVGYINVAFINDEFNIEYIINDGYEVCELSFYAGRYQNDNSNYYHFEFDTPTSNPPSFTLSKSEGDLVYIRGSAKISSTN